MKTLYEYFNETQDFLNHKKINKGSEFPIGIKSVDDEISFDKGQIMVIGGSSGMGKSSLALQMAWELSLKDKEVLIFSLEMTGKELLGRLLCTDQKIDNQLLRTGESFDAEYKEKLKNFKEKIKENSMTIMENKGYRFSDITRVMEEEYSSHKPDIIFLDYLQLIEWSGNQNEAIISYLRKLTELAKTHQIALVIISQLRRPMAGSNYDRKPSKHDLLGSSLIDQSAHIILLLYKKIIQGIPNYYIQIAKNRMGRCEELEVDFRGKYYQFRGMR